MEFLKTEKETIIIGSMIEFDLDEEINKTKGIYKKRQIDTFLII